MRHLIALLAVMLLSLHAENILMRWDAKAMADTWIDNGHFADLRYEDGVFKGRCVKHDPQFRTPLFSYQSSFQDEVRLRLRTSRPGQCQLYYACNTEPPYDGFRGTQVINFDVHKANEWENITLQPLFAVTQPIVHFRFDPPDDVSFEIAYLEIVRKGENITSNARSWTFKDNRHPEWFLSRNLWHCAPTVNIPASDCPYLQFNLQTAAQARVTIRLATDQSNGLFTHELITSPFDVPDKLYCLDLRRFSGWKGNLKQFMMQIVTEHNQPYTLSNLTLTAQPSTQDVVSVRYFGPENYPNRLADNGFYKDGNRVLLKLQNLSLHPVDVEIHVDGLDEILTGTITEQDVHTFAYNVKNTAPGTVTPSAKILVNGQKNKILAVTGKSFPVTARPTLHDGATDVPEPRPAKTDYLIGSYYYPGYGTSRQWRQMALSAPQTKPVLGYYDEGKTECIDWQIKWAVEHGVSFFLVDWYWCAGRNYNEHWLKGFAKAKHRRYLKWAIMWANHNPPNTHSREDWLNVVNRWLTQYMNTDEYLRLNGKPVVFIWSPRNLVNDMKGTQPAAELLKLADQMAKDAGLPGIDFYAMGNNEPGMLAECGYRGYTTYHWWHSAATTSPNHNFYSYKAVVDGAEAPWEQVWQHNKDHGLHFLPVIDTGWDARPRHGLRTSVIYDRSPQEFQRLLAKAKTWMDAHQEKIAILGPWNEWTEGSYIEPCSEWGFDMLRAIRQVFCRETADSDDTSPRDLWGTSHHYDFDLNLEGIKRAAWDFKTAQSYLGWHNMMGLQELQLTSRGIETQSITHDPAIAIGELSLNAADYQALEVVMSISPAPANVSGYDHLTLFWSPEYTPYSDQAAKSMPLQQTDGLVKYVLPLAGHSQWKGKINNLRLDPIQRIDKKIVIESLKLIPAK